VISAGSIQKIDAQGGDVGQDTSLITISCTALTGFVRGKNVYADITASSGDVGLIQSTKILGGELVASISAQNILNPAGGDGILVNGDLDLTLTLAGGTNPSIRDDVIITGGDFTQNSSISAWGIGDAGEFSIIKTGAGGGFLKGDITFTGSLSPQSPFRIDESLEGTLNIGLHLWDSVTINGISSNGDGLVGQIIVNGTNTTGQWRSPVIVGGTTLAPTPYYDNPSSTIGGGAVGLVPYNCHLGDCTPAGVKDDDDSNGIDDLEECEDGYHAIVLLDPTDPPHPSVTLRHYGPIEQHGIDSRPFTVKRKSLGAIGCVWTNISSQFTHTLPSNDARAIIISGPFAAGYDYLIEPRPHGIAEEAYLYCGGLDPAVGEVGLYAYDYRLRVAIRQDITVNGALAPDDISAWLANPVDTTLDGVADTADLVDVTEAVAESGDW
jgi:hypothetical protein